MVGKLNLLLAVVVLFAAPLVAAAQPMPAFSGAEGAGAFATGGRPVEKLNYYPNGSNPVLEKRGIVYHVTTLDPDPEGVLPGSLMYGLKTENFWYQTHPFQAPNITAPDSFDVTPRIIVFDVGGTIDFSTLPENQRTIDITPMNFTIAGQTAPGGITLFGTTFNPGHREDWDNAIYYPDKTNNLVMRNFAVRTDDPREKDALSLPATNSIADHLSLSWHSDEGASITDAARDVTIQHSIIGPGVTEPDGQGSQFEGKTPHAKYSVHHNLYISNAGRIPRVGEKAASGAPGVDLDFRNNIIYNWNATEAGYSVPLEPSFSNFVNNYYIGGAGNGNGDDIFDGGGPLTRMYQSGNVLDLNKDGAANGTTPGWAGFTGTMTQVATPYTVPHGVTQTPAEALNTVQNYVGANWWDRDFLDERAMQQLATFGQGTVSQTGQVLGSVPQVDVDAVLGAPMQTRTADWDADNDGMPGWWELRHGLNPTVGDDWKDDDDGDGYINVEEYINEVAEWAAPDDIQWMGGNARYAEIFNWGITRSNPDEADTTTNWQPSRFDTAVIDGGTVEVDAVGQHAKFIRLATNGGDNATLNVTGGWLKVEQELEVGVHASATAAVNLSGGTLSVGELSLGAGGSFSFTGGTLSADDVNFDLVNDGGTIAPGQQIASFQHNGEAPNNSVGPMAIHGDLDVNGGALHVELASTVLHDLLLVDDAAILGGDLLVSLAGGFLPDPSDSFTVLTSTALSGAFDNVLSGSRLDTFDATGSFLVSYDGLTNAVILSDFLQAEALPLYGDYNGNDVIDSADYTVWRDAMTAGSSSLLNDPTPGTVDESDFAYWRDNFGSVAGGGSGQGSAVVPEPGGLLLGSLAVLAGMYLRRRASQG